MNAEATRGILISVLHDPNQQKYGTVDRVTIVLSPTSSHTLTLKPDIGLYFVPRANILDIFLVFFKFSVFKKIIHEIYETNEIYEIIKN